MKTTFKSIRDLKYTTHYNMKDKLKIQTIFERDEVPAWEMESLMETQNDT